MKRNIFFHVKALALSAITALFLVPVSAQAQLNFNRSAESATYSTAIGLRAGETSGLTFKKFVGGPNAIEFIVGVWPYGFSATGLYERHANAGLEGLNWYYGGGGHVAEQSGRIYYAYRDRRYDYYYRSGSDLGIGIDGIVGLEYKIKPIPFAVSLDLKPFLEVNTAGAAFISLDPGLGVKVAF